MNTNKLPILAVTMGDASGVGPEIIAKAVVDERVRAHVRPLVIGDAAVMTAAAEVAGVEVPVRSLAAPEEADYQEEAIQVLDLHNIDLPELPRGRVNVMAGRAAYQYIERAVELALAREVQGIVTAPLNKEALHLAGCPYPGHTEVLAALCHVQGVVMMLVGGNLRVSHVSTHVPLCEAINRVRRERIISVAKLTLEAVERLTEDRPRLAVAGLNPHAGEGGLFGREEIEEIAPAVDDLQREGYDVEGPIPPDTVFWRASRREFDAVIAMYHDQGHIPVKLMAFDEGVNVTLGLPVIRTSVDHGTAFDIAWTGVARPASMIAALLLGAKMALGR